MSPSNGCFDRFFMAAMAVIVAVAIAAGVVAITTNRVSAQNSDWSQFKNGKLYLINPVGQINIYNIQDTPRVQDGFLCAIVDQYQVETCFPLTNIAGVMSPIN